MNSGNQYLSKKWGFLVLAGLSNYWTHAANTTSAQAALVGNAINLVANGKTLSGVSGLAPTNLSSAVTSMFGSWQNLIASSVVLDLSLNASPAQINAIFNNQLTSSAATSLANNFSGVKPAPGPASYTSNLIQAIKVLANGAQASNVFPSLYALIDGQTSATSGAATNGLNILLSTAFQVGGFGALYNQLSTLNVSVMNVNVSPIDALTNSVGATQQSSATQAGLTNLLSIAAQSPAATITLTPTLVGQGIFGSSTTSINLSIPSGLAQLLTTIGATNLLQNIIPKYVSAIHSATDPFSSSLAFLVQAVGAGPLIVAGVESNQLSQLVGLTNEPQPQQASAYALAQSLIQSAGGIGTVYNLLAPLYGNSPVQTFNALVNFASMQGLLTLAGNSVQTLASSVGGGSTIIQWLAVPPVKSAPASTANLINLVPLLVSCNGNLNTLATDLGVSVTALIQETNVVTNLAPTFGGFPKLFSALVSEFTNGATLLMNIYGGITQLAAAAGGIEQLVLLALSTNNGFNQLISAYGSIGNLATAAGGITQLITLALSGNNGFSQLSSAYGSIGELAKAVGGLMQLVQLIIPGGFSCIQFAPSSSVSTSGTISNPLYSSWTMGNQLLCSSCSGISTSQCSLSKTGSATYAYTDVNTGATGSLVTSGVVVAPQTVSGVMANGTVYYVGTSGICANAIPAIFSSGSIVYQGYQCAPPEPVSASCILYNQTSGSNLGTALSNSSASNSNAPLQVLCPTQTAPSSYVASLCTSNIGYYASSGQLYSGYICTVARSTSTNIASLTGGFECVEFTPSSPGSTSGTISNPRPAVWTIGDQYLCTSGSSGLSIGAGWAIYNGQVYTGNVQLPVLPDPNCVMTVPMQNGPEYLVASSGICGASSLPTVISNPKYKYGQLFEGYTCPQPLALSSLVTMYVPTATYDAYSENRMSPNNYLLGTSSVQGITGIALYTSSSGNELIGPCNGGIAYYVSSGQLYVGYICPYA